MIAIPNVDGAGTLVAAQLYAAAGLYVGPLRKGTKNPGLILGGGWQHKTSRCPDEIHQWFADTDHDVFIHCGRSGLVVIDVDYPDKVPPVLGAHLGSAPYQSTRPDQPGRGHYIFAQPPGRTIGNGQGKLGSAWGDVRGLNGVIVAAPSDDSRYCWVRAGAVPVLPDDVGDQLGNAVRRDGDEPTVATDAQVALFVESYADASWPSALDGRVKGLESYLAAGNGRHTGALPFITGALEEAACGFYSAQDAVDRLWPLFRAAALSDSSRSESSARNEFGGLLAWAVARALESDPDEIRKRVQDAMPDNSKLFDNIAGNARREESSEQPNDRPKADRRPLPKVSTTVLSTVKAEKVSWLWKGRLPKGKLVTLDGDPGLGKSTLAVELIAHITTGSDWPDDTTPEYTGAVVVFSAEDGLADTVRPRVDAAGGDATKVAAVIGVPTGYDDDDNLVIRPLTLGDTEAIEAAIVEHGAILAVVDVLMAFLPGATDSHRDQDVRRVLSQLSTIAERTGCTFIFIRHLTKGSGGGDPMYRGGGSIGIIGAARLGLAVARDPDDDERRVLAVVKSNLAAIAPSLAYRLEETPPLGVGRVVWDGEVEHTAADLLRNAGGGNDRQPWSQVWLSAYLADGRRKSTDVKEAAEREDIKERTLQYAAQKLGVVVSREGFPSVTYWELPSRAPAPQHERDCATARQGPDDDDDSQSRSRAVADTLENTGATDTVENPDYPLCTGGCGLPIGPVDIRKGRTHHGMCA